MVRLRKKRRKRHHDDDDDSDHDDDHREDDNDDNDDDDETTLTRSQRENLVVRKSIIDGGEVHQQAMSYRDKEERTPMTPRQRVSMYLQKRIIPGLNDVEATPTTRTSTEGRKNKSNNIPSAATSSSSSSPGGAVSVRRQYRVKTTTRRCNTTSSLFFFSSFWRCLVSPNNPDDFSYSPNGWAVSYINWTFRSGFGVVFLSFLLFFFFVAFVFGVLFKYAGQAQPQCIVVAGDEFGSDSPHTTLADGFALSWTTFTTVGYGALYTATGNDTTDQTSCLLITILCTAESFIGLLYAGICTAIMFGKIGRIQSHAQVIFSDALCVEFGTLETTTTTTNNTSTNNADDLQHHNNNNNKAYRGLLSDRGIMSARGVLSEIPMESGRSHHMNSTSSSNSRMGQLSSHHHHHYRSTSEWRKHQQQQHPLNGTNRSSTDLTMEDDDGDESSGRIYSDLPVVNPKNQKILCPVLRFQLVNQLANQPFGEILDAHMNVMVRKEQESYPYEPIARFLRVHLEEPNHPFFNRVWHGRHVLDENSPLVSVEARQMIYNNDGYWPPSLNSAERIQHHLRFSSLIITMTGISNISAESVQIAKRYYLPDVLVGFTFAPVLFQTNNNQQLYVDMKLVNDVIEQEDPIHSMMSTTSSPPPAWKKKQQQEQQKRLQQQQQQQQQQTTTTGDDDDKEAPPQQRKSNNRMGTVEEDEGGENNDGEADKKEEEEEDEGKKPLFVK